MLLFAKFVRQSSVAKTLAVAANVEVLWIQTVIIITMESTENQPNILGQRETWMMKLKH